MKSVFVGGEIESKSPKGFASPEISTISTPTRSQSPRNGCGSSAKVVCTVTTRSRARHDGDDNVSKEATSSPQAGLYWLRREVHWIALGFVLWVFRLLHPWSQSQMIWLTSFSLRVSWETFFQTFELEIFRFNQRVRLLALLWVVKEVLECKRVEVIDG